MKESNDHSEELALLKKAMEDSQREVASLKRKVQETRSILDASQLDIASLKQILQEKLELTENDFNNRDDFTGTISDEDVDSSEEFQSNFLKHADEDTVDFAPETEDNREAAAEEHEKNGINRNAYTFLFCSNFFSVAMQLGVLVVTLQFTLFVLFLSDLLSTQELPPDIGIQVRITQVICILICFLAQNDIRSSLRALIYREGKNEMKQFFPEFTTTKFMLANFILLLQGLLGVVVAMVLTVFSDNVFDLLLNFTAVMFVSELDEIVFQMALLGFVGRRTEKFAKKIQEVRFPIRKHKGFRKYIHIYIFILLLSVGYGYYFRVIAQQTDWDLLPEFIKVEFGDNLDPTLGLYSGCYGLVKNPGWSVRVSYRQAQIDRLDGSFDYCLEDEIRSWIFTPSHDEKTCDDPYLHSSEERPSSFNLLDAKTDQWLLRDGTPISKFQLVEVDPDRLVIECGDILSRQGVGEELCFSLTMDANLNGFVDSHQWSKNFEKLEDERGQIFTYYQHPVFIGEFTRMEGYEVVFFTGRRWILSSAWRLLGNIRASRTDLIDWFSSGETTLLTPNETIARPFAFVSEPVAQATDQGTPLGLRWYAAQYAESAKFVFADVSRPSDALFRCGNCDPETNPCRFGGICNPDGSCTCKNGANGTLCDIRPLSNGVCNDFFNTEVYSFDGGDCCAATCTAKGCGLVTDTTVAFGQNITRAGTSFPNCRDPLLNRLEIELSSTVGDLSLGSFEFYTVKVDCEDETPLIVTLDPKISGSSSQYIYVADSTASCELSVSGIQLWSKLSLSFEVLDKYYRNRIVMKRFENVTSDSVTRLPPPYNRCLKSTLKQTIEATELYSGSYRDKAMEWLHNETSGTLNCENDERLIERFALVAMSYAEVSSQTWISSRDHCFWTNRVSCNNDRITSLFHDGSNNGALGGTWAEEFTLLTSLESIDVFDNKDLQGTLPSAMGDLTSLTSFILTDSAIAGTIPNQLALLRNLEYCGLWTNALEGTIPTEFGNLRLLSSLYLYNNRLTGQIPSQIQYIPRLEHLGLFNNLLTGSLPEFSRHSSLKEFDLRTNRISGTLPPSLGLHSQLYDFRLYDNRLTGSIPPQYSNFRDLEVLRVENNRLTGEIEPSLFGNWSNLIDLRLSNQFFTGRLPTTIGGLRAIEVMYLDHNAFEGPIPTELSGLQNLTNLYLDSNLLTGVFNSELTNLPLQVLRLQNNTLNGTIPTEIGLLAPTLFFLSLSDNRLSGSLPSEIGLLTNLEYLHLGGNRLEGAIPDEVLNLTSLQKIDLSENLFSEAEVNRIVAALGLAFSCDETTVEILLTTDPFPGDTSFEITTPDGLVVASAGNYTLDIHVHEEIFCVPTNACNFTIFDEYEDGGPAVEINRLGKTYNVNSTFQEKSSVDICI